MPIANVAALDDTHTVLGLVDGLSLKSDQLRQQLQGGERVFNMANFRHLADS